MERQDIIKRHAFFWNTASGMINAGQSAIILVFIAHFLSKTEAGVFTIAIALANLIMTIGKYGIRNFQVTDIKEQFNFNQYLTSRFITTFLTLFLTIFYLYILYYTGNYSINKFFVVLIICLWKVIDTIEDVFYGMYQQKGRLDIGAKYYTFRVFYSTILMCILLVFKLSLIISALIVLITSILLASIFILLTIKDFNIDNIRFDFTNQNELLVSCFPLFISMTLSIYIGNSPKYLIDMYLDDDVQAIFGYLMMPAFTIMVINQFIYQPIIRDLGEMWQLQNKKIFIKRVLKQYLVVAAITLTVIFIGSTIGLPILSLLYNTDLRNYTVDFIILLFGGGIYALASFIMVPITAMRLQKFLAYGFLAVSISSIPLGYLLLNKMGIRGATILYLTLNLLLAAYLTISFLLGCKYHKRLKCFKTQ